MPCVTESSSFCNTRDAPPCGHAVPPWCLAPCHVVSCRAGSIDIAPPPLECKANRFPEPPPPPPPPPPAPCKIPAPSCRMPCSALLALRLAITISLQGRFSLPVPPNVTLSRQYLHMPQSLSFTYFLSCAHPRVRSHLKRFRQSARGGGTRRKTVQTEALAADAPVSHVMSPSDSQWRQGPLSRHHLRSPHPLEHFLCWMRPAQAAALSVPRQEKTRQGAGRASGSREHSG